MSGTGTHPRSERCTTDAPISVYVADDHELVRVHLVDHLNQATALQVIGSAGDPIIAAHEIVALQPEVAVLDGDFGTDTDGLAVCEELRVTAPSVACVLLTAGVGLTWGPAEASAAGAAAYLVKKLGDFPLVEVIERVARGERPGQKRQRGAPTNDRGTVRSRG